MRNEIVFAFLAFRIFRILGGAISLQKISEVLIFLLTVFLEIGGGVQDDSGYLQQLSWATPFLTLC